MKFMVTLALIAAGFVLSFLQGWLVSTIGDWYDLFHISPIQAIGVGLLVSLPIYALARNPKFAPPTDRTGDAAWWESTLYHLIFHAIMLVIVYLCALFWSFFL